MIRKVFVKVLVEYDEQGHIRPLRLTWEDGRDYEIDEVVDVRQAPSLKAGGCGMRYTCRIREYQFYLFFEEPRWFLEAESVS